MTAPLASLADYGTHDESARPELWAGCVGAWCPSLGATGTRLHDFSACVGWGELQAMDPATDWPVSGGGICLDFEGVNSYVTLPYKNTETLTVACWVFARNINDASGQYYVSKWGANPTLAENDFYLGSFANNWIARSGDGSSGSTSLAQSAATANRWTHLAISRDASTLRLFVDGVETNSVSAVGFQGGGTATTRLCFITALPYANCQLDDIRIYNRALHPEEIRALALRRAIAFEREELPVWYVAEELEGVAGPVLFNAHYQNQGWL